MIEVDKNIFIAKEDDIPFLDSSKYAFVSAAHTFHYRYHKWNRGENHQTHPCYVLCEEEENLISVNWIDGAKHLFDWKGGGVFVTRRIMDFMLKQYLHEKPIVVFCNQATSRAPSIALLFLAKRIHHINDYSFDAAREEFLKKYPQYVPKGIAEFLSDHWEEF